MPDLSTVHPFLEDRHIELAQAIRAIQAEIASLPPAHEDADAGRQAREILTGLGEAGLFRPQVLSESHPLGEIAFDGCRMPAENLVGAEARASRRYADAGPSAGESASTPRRRSRPTMGSPSAP